MKTSAASENAIECSVTYDKTLFGMWSMKMTRSDRPRKRSSLRSRRLCCFGSASAPPYRAADALLGSDNGLDPRMGCYANDLAVGRLSLTDAAPSKGDPLSPRDAFLFAPS